MKNLLGLLVVVLVLGFAFTHKGEDGQSMLDKMTGEDGAAAQIQNAEAVVGDYQDATQRRIDAEFAQ